MIVSFPADLRYNKGRLPGEYFGKTREKKILRMYCNWFISKKKGKVMFSFL